MDIVCQNCWNIQANPDWLSNDEFDYKISKQLNSIRLLRPHILGKRSLNIPIRTIQPVVQKKTERLGTCFTIWNYDSM